MNHTLINSIELNLIIELKKPYKTMNNKKKCIISINSNLVLPLHYVGYSMSKCFSLLANGSIHYLLRLVINKTKGRSCLVELSNISVRTLVSHNLLLL